MTSPPSCDRLALPSVGMCATLRAAPPVVIFLIGPMSYRSFLPSAEFATFRVTSQMVLFLSSTWVFQDSQEFLSTQPWGDFGGSDPFVSAEEIWSSMIEETGGYGKFFHKQKWEKPLFGFSHFFCKIAGERAFPARGSPVGVTPRPGPLSGLLPADRGRRWTSCRSGCPPAAG